MHHGRAPHARERARGPCRRQPGAARRGAHQRVPERQSQAGGAHEIERRAWRRLEDEDAARPRSAVRTGRSGESVHVSPSSAAASRGARRTPPPRRPRSAHRGRTPSRRVLRRRHSRGAEAPSRPVATRCDGPHVAVRTGAPETTRLRSTTAACGTTTPAHEGGRAPPPSACDQSGSETSPSNASSSGARTSDSVPGSSSQVCARSRQARTQPTTYSSAIASTSSRIAIPSSTSSRVIVSGGTTMITFQCVIR